MSPKHNLSTCVALSGFEISGIARFGRNTILFAAANCALCVCGIPDTFALREVGAFERVQKRKRIGEIARVDIVLAEFKNPFSVRNCSLRWTSKISPPFAIEQPELPRLSSIREAKYALAALCPVRKQRDLQTLRSDTTVRILHAICFTIRQQIGNFCIPIVKQI